MSEKNHKLDVNVLRVGQVADERNFYCEIPAEHWRRVVISVPLAALPDRPTRVLTSLIERNDKVHFDFDAEDAGDGSVQAFLYVTRLHGVVNKDALPDPPEYLVSINSD